MQNYLFMLAITFTVVVSAALVVNFCKGRARNTKHGLTGMCHKSGGTMCACSASKLTPQEGHNPSSLQRKNSC